MGRSVRTPEEAVENRTQTPEIIAKALLERCEGTMASLAAQLALMVSEDFVPCENIARNRMVAGIRRKFSRSSHELRNCKDAIDRLCDPLAGYTSGMV